MKRSAALREYIKNNKYCLILLYWPIHILWYELTLLLYADREVLFIHCAADDVIPFIEWFAIFYCCWYPFIIAVTLYSMFKGKRQLIRCCAAIYGCLFIPILFCTIVPNGLSDSMRPDFEALGRNNPAIWIVKFIYASDSPPRNVMPSMHCSVSVALAYILLKCETLKEKVWLKAAGTLLSLLIIISTVFIKQHSLLDLIAGTLLGLAVSTAVYFAERIYDKRKARKKLLTIENNL